MVTIGCKEKRYDQLVRSCLLITKRYLVLPVVCMGNIDLSAKTCKQFANQLRTYEECDINHREHVSSNKRVFFCYCFQASWF